jgi:hypothetical protein
MANLHKIWEKTSERDCDQHANEEERNILCNISNTQQTTKWNKMRFTSQVTSTREKCQSIWATAAFQLNRKWSSAQRSTFNCCSADNAERYMMNLTPNGWSLTQCNIYQHTLLGRWGVQFIGIPEFQNEKVMFNTKNIVLGVLKIRTSTHKNYPTALGKMSHDHNIFYWWTDGK